MEWSNAHCGLFDVVIKRMKMFMKSDTFILQEKTDALEQTGHLLACDGSETKNEMYSLLSLGKNRR
jgi:hypothetical protein